MNYNKIITIILVVVHLDHVLEIYIKSFSARAVWVASIIIVKRKTTVSRSLTILLWLLIKWYPICINHTIITFIKSQVQRLSRI